MRGRLGVHGKAVRRRLGGGLRLLERRTSLRRKPAGNIIENQMIAANVDHVVIVPSCHVDFNLKRLERYLVMGTESGAEPYVLLTKTDLVDPAVLAAQRTEIRSAGFTAPIGALSSLTWDGVDALKALLLPRKSYWFVGVLYKCSAKEFATSPFRSQAQEFGPLAQVVGDGFIHTRSAGLRGGVGKIYTLKSADLRGKCGSLPI